MFRTKFFVHISCALLFGLGRLSAQSVDTLSCYDLMELEVVAESPASGTASSAPKKVMDKGDFLRLGASSLADAAKSLVGVDVRDYGGVGGLKTVSVRGIGAKHTAVSYDGVMVADAQSGLVDIGRLSLDNVSMLSMEIGQGDDIFKPAREYASSGILSMSTGKPRANTSSLRVGTGAFGLADAALHSAFCFGSGWAASFNARFLRSDGEYPFLLVNGDEVTREKRSGSDICSVSYEGNLYAAPAGGDLRVKLYGYNSERGLPGAVNLYNKDNKERLWDDNFFVQAKYELPLPSGFALKGVAKYNYQFSEYKEWNKNYAGGLQDDRNTQHETYASLGVSYAPFRSFSMALTGDVAYSALENNFENSKSPRRFSSYTVLAASYDNGVFTATASLLGTLVTDRLENVVGQPEPFRSLSPSLALSYKPLGRLPLRLRLSFKENCRIPTFADLYYQRLGNVNLKPERALQNNLGITWESGSEGILDKLSVTVDVYYNKVYDKIVALPTMYVWRMMNFGEADIAGVDAAFAASVSLSRTAALLVDAGYSFMHAVDVTDPSAKNYRHQLPYTPRHSGKFSLSLLNSWVNVTYMLQAVGERYMLPQNTERNRMPGYLDHSFSLNREFPFKKFTLRLQGEVLNVGNSNYEVIAYYPMPGFSWRLSATFIF